MAHDRVTAALVEQLAFYRRAASEYDRKYGNQSLINEVARRLRKRVDLSGDVLEIACGVGQWTAWLANSARFVTAIDAAPEMLELARHRLPADMAGRVELLCADVFTWHPQRCYQTVFFSFWLSHVPNARFAAFWEVVAASLAPGGRVVFVDNGLGRAVIEDDLKPDPCLPTARRRLADGSEFRVIKVLHDPQDLARSLASLGWTVQTEALRETLLLGFATLD